jgi:hypothetical protein
MYRSSPTWVIDHRNPGRDDDLLGAGSTSNIESPARHGNFYDTNPFVEREYHFCSHDAIFPRSVSGLYIGDFG